MYSRLKSIQILISLLKKHGVKHLVLSPGQSNNAFVRSVETDPDFTCYSVVDERSAAFFALGLSQELQEPVGLSCTASTATCNYLSAVTEAYYQGVPLVLLTSNRDIRNLDQLELLMIHQENLYAAVTKKEIQLPRVKDDRDFEYCERIINEALLELDHHGKGPIHIDIPSYGENVTVDVSNLPKTKAVRRHSVYRDDLSVYKSKVRKAARVMLICGQGVYSTKEKELINAFAQRYSCVVAAEHMANIGLNENVININPIIGSCTDSALADYIPEILISMGRHVQFDWCRFKVYPLEHWIVNEDGSYYDPSGKVTEIFEGTKEDFLKCFLNTEKFEKKDRSYLQLWQKAAEQITIPEEELCHVFAIQNFLCRMPKEALLHLSIYNSIRIAQFFKVPEQTTCYANMGALGIDGSMSAFLGQASASDKEAFLIIGDLSFFYDMNSLMIRHIKKNVHILLLNNHGGAEFYQNNGKYETLDLHSAARHNTSAKEWIKSNGFLYLSASSREEYLKQIDEFVVAHEKPIIFEVFTEMETDMNALYKLRVVNEIRSEEEIQKEEFKKKVKGLVGEKRIEVAKKLFRH